MIKAPYSPLTGWQKVLCKIGLQTFLVCGSFSLIAGLLFLSHQFNKLDLILKPIYKALKKLQLDSGPLEKFSANITRMFGQGFTTRGSIIIFGSLVFLFLLSCYTGCECHNLLQKDAKERCRAANDSKKASVVSSTAVFPVGQVTNNNTDSILPKHSPVGASSLASLASAFQPIETVHTTVENIHIQVTGDTADKPALAAS